MAIEVGGIWLESAGVANVKSALVAVLPARSAETTLAWYRFVLPPAVNSDLAIAVHAATGEADAGRRVHLSFRDRGPEPEGWFGLVLDERGELVPGGLRLSDRYLRLQADVDAGRADPSELPNVEAIRLGSVPKAVP